MIRGLLLLFMLLSYSVHAVSTQIEYRNTGLIDDEWIAKDIVVGNMAPRGGVNSFEQWLFQNYTIDKSGNKLSHPFSEASIYTAVSNSVSLVMDGGHSDSFADFYVDELHIAQFDLYQQGFKELVVTGLDTIIYSFKIMKFDHHNENAIKGDIAILNNAEFNTLVNLAAVSDLSVLSLLLFLLCSLFWGSQMRVDLLQIKLLELVSRNNRYLGAYA